MKYTEEYLRTMFESINENDYNSLKELADALNVSTSILNAIRKKLELFDMEEELLKIDIIKEKGKTTSKEKFVRLYYKLKEAINFILDNGTELDYMLQYKWRTKKEIKDLLDSIDLRLTKEEYIKVIRFVSTIEDMQVNHSKHPGLTKSMILSETKRIIGGYEVTTYDKELAMNYMQQSNCRWTSKLYNQAIRKVLIEKGVLG